MASENSPSDCQGGKSNDDNSSLSEENFPRKRSRDEEVDEKKKKKMNSESSSSRKKNRFQWKPEIHLKFVNAVKQLEDSRCTPKKILELMTDEKDLTRDIIASHLQKHRSSLDKEKERKEKEEEAVAASAAAGIFFETNLFNLPPTRIHDNSVGSSQELLVQNHDTSISNQWSLLPMVDWSNRSLEPRNDAEAALMPPPQQTLFQPLQENLHTDFLSNVSGGIGPLPPTMVHNQPYSFAAAASDVNQQQLHPYNLDPNPNPNPNPPFGNGELYLNTNPNPNNPDPTFGNGELYLNPNTDPTFGNAELYLNSNGQDPFIEGAEHFHSNMWVKAENGREGAENGAETSGTVKMNGGGFPNRYPY